MSSGFQTFHRCAEPGLSRAEGFQYRWNGFVRNQIKKEAIRRFGNSRKDRRYLHWVFSKQGNGSKVSVKPALTQNVPGMHDGDVLVI